MCPPPAFQSPKKHSRNRVKTTFAISSMSTDKTVIPL